MDRVRLSDNAETNFRSIDEQRQLNILHLPELKIACLPKRSRSVVLGQDVDKRDVQEP